MCTRVDSLSSSASGWPIPPAAPASRTAAVRRWQAQLYRRQVRTDDADFQSHAASGRRVSARNAGSKRLWLLLYRQSRSRKTETQQAKRASTGTRCAAT